MVRGGCQSLGSTNSTACIGAMDAVKLAIADHEDLANTRGREDGMCLSFPLYQILGRSVCVLSI